MSLLNRILKPGAKVVWTAVDAAHGGIHCVSVEPPAGLGGKPKVLACGAVEGGDLDAPSLLRLAKSAAVSGSAWVVALDRKTYGILVAEEPAVRSDEMEESVRWAISSLIDYPVVDAAVAWMKIPTEKLLPNRPPHIYAVAARREMVERYRQVFKEAKLTLQAVDVQETAYRNIAALIAKPGEGVALLSIGRRGLQLVVTFQGEMYLDRYVDETAIGSSADDVALERARERVVLQVQRSLDFIGRTLPFIDINRLVLAPMPGETGLRDRIAENLPVPVESLDLSSVFDFSSTPQLKDESNQANYFVALGAALRFMGGAA